MAYISDGNFMSPTDIVMSDDGYLFVTPPLITPTGYVTLLPPMCSTSNVKSSYLDMLEHILCLGVAIYCKPIQGHSDNRNHC